LAVRAFDQPSLQWVPQVLVYVVAGFTVFSGFHYSVIIARRLSHS
jgi:hypothetical protein